MANRTLLQQELRVVVSQINVQMHTIERAHKRIREMNPMTPESVFEIQNPDGSYVMGQMLLAKATALGAIAALESAGWSRAK